ncbi:MAG: glycosyl transferase family 2 [Acidobacteriaceae bacterium]|nr:glycosyl transferase family 2 [Acidobacteriaceae bacterium]
MQEGTRVCAIVVTWQPGQEVAGELARLLSQVDGMVVVDNGSRVELLQGVRETSRASGFNLIELKENLGIAAAQNMAIAWAEAQGFELAIFFDQDSAVPNNFVKTMVMFYDEDSSKSTLAIVAPRYRDSRLGTDLAAARVADGGLALAMCSGSLIPLTVLRRIGGFQEDLFIDYVDYDFSLRARAAGYILKECSAAVLLHAPADPQRRMLFSLLPVTTANYSASRRYYLARNLIWMVRHYSFRFPAICLWFGLNFLKDSIKIVLVEDSALEKSLASMRGVADGLRGKMGRASGDVRAARGRAF